ncbi:MAG: S-adenosylmethionine:tRNA ribosyltransferase-isomerase [Parcubacteria group bacterium GW2011_GWC2_39_14]|nr:MAG: S-adenosylmethionine:tRNA ribosyltransferase-isomerase [Parcubacteria group bacterium GW2011_GWC2_39_14]KKR55401.1 MAG: S-adenosylmethionine:tRNA ribosyltransferase-isomerase [Parcubacteria group bacterium GW2011_GWA2_40_23]
MNLKLFDYKLPSELIAQKPATPRDSARLLIYDRKTKKIEHKHFYDLPKYLTKNDVLVFNDSKVMPARLMGNKESGGRAEVLLLDQTEDHKWEVLLGLRNPQVGLKLLFKAGLKAQVISRNEGKTWLVEFNFKGKKFNSILLKIGQMPLPPYIHSKSTESVLQKQYQTIYAKKLGSAAAPTAGLHFTKKLLTQIKRVGCQIEFVTLHVGLGTFDPVNTEKIEDYQIHSEYIEVNKQTINQLIKAKKAGKRIIAVGTTSLRTLETAFSNNQLSNEAIKQNTSIFIYPGYKFKFVDALISNFHLPKSSLLMLVSALIGRKTTLELYQKAIKQKYKFFSFGDACFFK